MYAFNVSVVADNKEDKIHTQLKIMCWCRSKWGRGANNYASIKEIIVIIISFINYPIQFAQASEDEEMQEELAIREEVDQDFKQVLDKLEASDKYKITLRYMNVDSNEITC